MDPISQGLIGSTASQSAATNPNHYRWIFLIGFLAGMAPDLDIFIKSDEDPLLFLDFHRQFTHSLIFIPIGGLLVATLFNALFHKITPLTFRQTWLYATLGYATHGLLDGCTSYGTQLLWPFTDQRFAWNNVSIVDPLFTLPILTLSALSLIRKKSWFPRAALLYALFYLSIGLVQNHRAENLLFELAQQRGHQASQVTVKPSFGNLVLWKLIYEHDGRYYVDAARILVDSDIISGQSIEKLNLEKHLPWLQADSIHTRDIERFRWYSDDYLTIHPQNREMVIDVRYSMIPNEIKPLWGILLNPKSQHQHVEFIHTRSKESQDQKRFLSLLFNLTE
ncbi:MAG: metal-dependent hydrolase [Gammaproteobacteria bacterium]|jgi:inner membrane protein|nr:metal-dependent hydrolase [Gammaproteobacteria bacterium]MBT4811743.1 metal-dependent hydrolase [Thiotrichales bacterium]MBT3473470.1 metal-dependent hydrolase [Gammaproteobacteria bacterium]MBT3718217.1 metal-dependent hydrolase [Gammaproteobacteria bacterium]MBT3966404.1 metal-dependent hydrolase [Gammaproteobacteria bacterium]